MRINIKSYAVLAVVTTLLFASPAMANDANDKATDLTFAGNAALVSQYRFRGVSQSDEDMAVQAGLTASHASGLYVGAWGSSLAGFGSYGGSNTELDLYAGFRKEIGDLAVDVGLLWYLYPGTDRTDYAEPYASLSGTVGPASLKLGAAYAPKQDAIGDADNLYVYTDGSVAIPGAPVTLKAHLGYTTGSGATLAGPHGDYVDWLIGADATWKMLTLGIAYVDTDIGKTAADAFYTSGTTRGRTIVDGAALVSLTASF